MTKREAFEYYHRKVLSGDTTALVPAFDLRSYLRTHGTFDTADFIAERFPHTMNELGWAWCHPEGNAK